MSRSPGYNLRSEYDFPVWTGDSQLKFAQMEINMLELYYSLNKNVQKILLVHPDKKVKNHLPKDKIYSSWVIGRVL